ncbi:DNA topoisomerase 2-binding protein 1, partial [Actinomortierella ambigua]
MFRQSNPRRSQTMVTPTAGPTVADSSTSATTVEPALNVQTIPVRPLDRCIVSYTGLTASERNQVNRLVKALGGKAVVDMTEDVNYLIATKTMTPKYKIAFTLAIPVVEPDWLQEIYQEWNMGHEVNLKDTRTEIETYTTLYGGSFTPDMLRGNTTHLICDVAKGKKYTMAQIWGIKCVSYKWFVECMRTLELVDESAYPAPTEEERREEKKNADPLSNPIMDVRADGIPDLTYLERCHFYLCPTFDEEGIAKCKMMIRMGGGLQVAQYDEGEVTHVVVPGTTIDESTMALFKEAKNLPCIVSIQWLKACSKAHKRISESQHVVPFPTRSEAAHPKNQHLHGPQTWTTDPIVSAAASASSRQQSAARPRLEDTRASNVATLRSGRGGGGGGSTTESAAGRRSGASNTTTNTTGSTFHQHREHRPPSPPTSPAASPPQQSSSSSSPGDCLNPKHTRRSALVHRSMSGLLAQDVADLSIDQRLSGGGGVSPSMASMIGKTDHLALEDPDSGGNNNSSGNSSGSRGPLSLSFGGTTMSLVQEQYDEGSESETEKRVSNKDLFSALSFTTFGCKEDTVRTVRAETEQYGGKFYEEGTVPVEEQEAAYTIVPRFSDLNISLSSTLDELECIQLTKLIKILGATYHENVLKSSTNLLISNAAVGPKFEFMWKNQRPVVSCEWLKQSVAAGRALPYAPYLVVPKNKAAGVPETVQRTPSGDIGSQQRTLPSLKHQRSDSPILADASPELTDTPLSGLVLCVTNKALGECQDLVMIIQDLGGQVVRQYNQSITHVVHKAIKARDTFKDLRQAKTDRKFVVAPEWVLKCRDERHRVSEWLYPETYDPKRRVLETTRPPPPTQTRSNPTLAMPRRPTLRSSTGSTMSGLGGGGSHIGSSSSSSFNHPKYNGYTMTTITSSSSSNINSSRSQLLSVEPSQGMTQMTDGPSYFYGGMSMETPFAYDSMTQETSMQHHHVSQLLHHPHARPSLSLSVDTSTGIKIRRVRKRKPDDSLTLEWPAGSKAATESTQGQAGSEPSSATSATPTTGTMTTAMTTTTTTTTTTATNSYPQPGSMDVDEGIDYSDEEGRAVRRKYMRRVDKTGWATREERQEDDDG